MLFCKLKPNNLFQHELDHANPLVLSIERPRAGVLTDVVIEIYEQDLLPGRRGVVYGEQGRGSANDLLATFKGKIRDGKFVLGSGARDVDLEVLSADASMVFPPAVALSVEGSDTRYKLILNRDDGESEGNDWDLQVKVKGKTRRGRVLSYVTRHPTFIKGAWAVYLDDRAVNRTGHTADARADIGPAAAPYPGYYRMLKRHMAILGFYEFEHEFNDRGTKDWRHYARGKGVSLRFFTDDWDDELSWAVEQFHLAAAQPWRIDAGSGEFVELGAGEVLFDPSDDQTKAEVDRRVIGDKSKEELIRWLGTRYQQVDGGDEMPVYRNPCLYSYGSLQRAFKNSVYHSDACLFDRKSGRIVNARYHAVDKTPQETPGFVCTTAVNSVFSHLFALGDEFNFSANAPLVDAILGLRQAGGGRSTPSYYHDYYVAGRIRPAFLLPWLDPRDPSRHDETLRFLRMHEGAHPVQAVPVSNFPVNLEVAELSAERSFTIRYLPRPVRRLLLRGRRPHVTADRAGLSFFTQEAGAARWAPRPWLPTHPLTLAHSPLANGDFKVQITFDASEDLDPIEGRVLLVSYAARDQFCEIRGRAYGLPLGSHYSCKCGLHKCYRELLDNFDQLDDWNLVNMAVSTSSLEYSTMVIFKEEGELWCVHAGYFGPLMREETRYHGWVDGRFCEAYYLVFAMVNNDRLLADRINPTFKLAP